MSPKCDRIPSDDEGTLTGFIPNVLDVDVDVDAWQKCIVSFDFVFLLFNRFSMSRRLGVNGIGKRFATAFGLCKRKCRISKSFYTENRSEFEYLALKQFTYLSVNEINCSLRLNTLDFFVVECGSSDFLSNR